jgi:hypothetical protein
LIWFTKEAKIELHTLWMALCSSGLLRGAHRRKLVNSVPATIYGCTSIKASQNFTNDPRIVQQPMLCATNKDYNNSSIVQLVELMTKLSFSFGSPEFPNGSKEA